MKNKLFLIITFALSFLLVVFIQQDKDYDLDEILAPEAFYAINDWSAKRAYPSNYIDDKKFNSEFIKYKNQQKNPPSLISNYTWETMGPHNRGGRTLCVTTNPQNPNTIFAGSASGGLWRSYNAGQPGTWERVSIGHPVLGVNSIAICPVDSNVIIIGTGEVYSYQGSNIGISVRTNRGSFGIGILKSTDGGLTWNKTLDWQYSEQHGVQIIKINPLNYNTIWAGTSIGTYKSYDGGDNWNIVDSTIMVTDIVINTLDTNQVLIACGNLESPGGGVYKTNNGGNTWFQANGIPNPIVGKIQICHAPSNPDIIYASVGDGINSSNQSSNSTYLCKSIDGGNNFSIVNTTNYANYQGWFSHDIAVHPDNPNAIICAGVNIYESDDGGQTLSSISTNMHVDHHYVAYNNNNPEELYVGNDGGVYKGNIFKYQNDITTSFNDNMGSGGIMFDISATNDIDVTSFGLNLYSGQKTIFIYYKNGTHIGFENDSLSWIFLDSISVNSSGSGSQTLVNLSSPIQCLQGQTYGLFLSNSEWPDFRYMSGNSTGSLHVNDPNISIYQGIGRRSKYFNSNIFQNRRFSGSIYYETPGSTNPFNYTYSFEARNDGYQTSQYYNGFANSRQDSNLALGGRQDNGTARYTGTLLWDHVLGADGAWAAIHPTNDDIMYGSYQRARIHKSVNGGNNFSQIFSPSMLGIPTSGLSISQTSPFVMSNANPDVLYVGTSYISKSTDAGDNWILMNGGNELNGSPSIAMATSFQDENVMYVSTSPITTSSAIFITNNGGLSFSDVTNNLPDRYPVDIAVDPTNDSIVYVVFSGFGTSHLYKSENRGLTWIDIGIGLPDVPTSAVFIDPDYPNHIYIGNDIGVFVSTNNGVHWHSFNNGLPEVVSVLDLSISMSNRKLRAATHGNGVYQIELLKNPINYIDNNIYGTINNFILFPNPAHKYVNIRFNSKTKQDIILQLLNQVGKVVFFEKLNNYSGNYYNDINLKDYSKGTYTLNIKSESGSYTKKIILQ